MALAITKPVKCPYCGEMMDMYSKNNTTGNTDFRCKCGKITSISDKQYRELLKRGEFAVKSGRA